MRINHGSWGRIVAVTLGAAALAASGVGCSSRVIGPGEAAEDGAPSALEAEAEVTCVTIQRGSSGAVADAQIREDQPTTSFGASTQAQVGAPGAGARAMLLQFDLGAIPAGAPITSATVTLAGGNGGPGSTTVHAATSGWDEATVTWDSFGGAFSAASSAFDASAFAGGQTSFDVAPLVQGWVDGAANHGLVLRRQGGGVLTFATSESDLRPALEVCYQDLCNDVTCAAQDACHLAGSCDPKTGLCSNPAAPDGTPCSDADACTSGDVCSGGTCGGAPPHDVCVTGDKLSPDCSTCAATVCAVDTFCCQAFWDTLCVQEAAQMCGGCGPICGDGTCNGSETCGTCPGDCGACPAVCGDGICNIGETCSACPGDCGDCPQPPSCSHSECTSGGPLLATCTECTDDVCAVDPFCCTGAWDAICVSESQTICGLCKTCGDGVCNPGETCGTCPGDCGACPPPSCGHDECTTGAALDASCTACTAQVCAVDAFCCSGAWDAICVNQSTSLCGLCH